MIGLKITFSIDNPDMTDSEYDDQEDQTFTISYKRLKQIIEAEIPMKKGDKIEWAYSYIEII